MAMQTVNLGSGIGAGDGDGLRVGGDKINDNFAELYAAADPTGIPNSNYIVNPAHNTIDTASGITTAAICGGGDFNTENAIGRVTKPKGSYPSAPAEWIDDASYPADGVAGSTAVIGGGYDHVNNQISGTICGGGHNYIRYNAGGHSTIVGGAYNLVTGLYSFIGGGQSNVDTGQYSVITGGKDNRITANASVIAGGILNTISADSSFTAGRENTVSALYSGAIGYQNAVSGAYSVSFGDAGVVTGAWASAMGQDNENSGTHSLIVGQDGLNKTKFCEALSATRTAIDGDTQDYRLVGGGLTTNTTITNMSGGLVLTNTDSFAGTGVVRLIGIDTAGNVAIFNQRFSFKMIAGVTTFYAEDGTSTAPGSTSESINLTPVVDEITVGTCDLRATTGASGTVLVRATGKAATNIKWTYSMQAAVTAID